MANKFYPKGKEKMLRAQINWEADTIKAVLVSTAYTQSDTHEFFNSVSATVVGTPVTLTTKTTTDGVFDAADLLYASLPSGSTLKALVLYKDTGVAGTSPLLMYIDTITGFPLATNGGNVVIQWDNGAYKIVSL